MKDRGRVSHRKENEELAAPLGIENRVLHFDALFSSFRSLYIACGICNERYPNEKAESAFDVDSSAGKLVEEGLSKYTNAVKKHEQAIRKALNEYTSKKSEKERELVKDEAKSINSGVSQLSKDSSSPISKSTLKTASDLKTDFTAKLPQGVPKDLYKSRSGGSIGVKKPKRECLEYLETLEKEIEDLINPRADTDKAIRRDIRRAANKAISQISMDRKQINSKIAELGELLDAAQRTMGKRIFQYSLWIIGDRFIAQAESQVKLHTNSAYSFAAVIVSLSLSHERLLDIVLGKLMRKSVFIIPDFPTDGAETEEDIRTSLNFKFNKSSRKWETLEEYLFRIAGYISLFAAIAQTPVDGYPIHLHLGWTWLAVILNQHARFHQMISPILISYLDVAGYRMFEVYGRQFRKILELLERGIVPKLDQKTASHNGRLQMYLENTKRDGYPAPLDSDADYSVNRATKYVE